MKEKHEYANYQGMSVPNGHTLDYIYYILNTGLYKTFDITYNDGDMDRAILINKINDNEFLCRNTITRKEFTLHAYKIHLIREVYN